jgi:chromosome segregation ATPase
MMQQYQQAAAQVAQLQADNSKLKKDLDDTKKQRDATSKQLATLKAGAGSEAAKLAAAEATSQAAAQNIEQTKAKLQEVIGRYRDLATNLRDVETQRSALQQQLTQTQSGLDLCAQRNYQLYQINVEILDRYQHQGLFSYLQRAEPFTQLKRTQIDNLALDYRQRAEELRVKQSGEKSGSVLTPAPSEPRALPSPASSADDVPKD